VRLLRSVLLVLACLVSTATLAAGQGQPFYSHDNHTEYDLLDPSTHRFAIVYFLTERRVGATVVLNQTRSGSAGRHRGVRSGDRRAAQVRVHVRR